MVSGQVLLSEASPTKATVGVPQLSASSVIRLTSGAGTSAEHCTLTPAGAVPVGGVRSCTVINCTTSMKLPHGSVILYVLVMISGHELPSDTSDCHVTVGNPLLSASSVIRLTSGAGTAVIQSTVMSAGAVPVGAIGSVINTSCVTLIELPHESVTE